MPYFTPMNLHETKFIYVGDPLCSWCWGISPQLKRLRDTYSERFPFELVVGGLLPYEDEPLSPIYKRFLRRHWAEVQALSGQPFNFEVLAEESNFVYNTERPCRAVAAVRKMAPEYTFDFFDSVQRAFYLDNRDTNQLQSYFPLLEQYRLDPQEFVSLFNQEEVRKDAHDDFSWAKQVGVKGFPTMLLQHRGELHAIAMGYSTFERMNRIVGNVLLGLRPGDNPVNLN